MSLQATRQKAGMGGQDSAWFQSRFMDSQPLFLIKMGIAFWNRGTCAQLGCHGATKGVCFRAAVVHIGFFPTVFPGE